MSDGTLLSDIDDPAIHVRDEVEVSDDEEQTETPVRVIST